ncbi:MAG: hypothetical protein ABI670_08900 [Chloroflexota bacterium]
MGNFTFTIGMDYPGWAISKNGLWKGGNKRWGMNDEAKRWKLNLAEGVQIPQIMVTVTVTVEEASASPRGLVK